MKCDRICLVIRTETNSFRIIVLIKFIKSVLVNSKGAWFPILVPEEKRAKRK